MPCQMTGSPEVVYRQIAGVNRTTRTQSVQDRIISETHSSLLQRGGRGKGAAAPFPCTPKSPPDLLRFASDHPSRTISLDEAEHFLHNHHASVASLRLLFAFTPERRSACLRNRCSPSLEYPRPA